MQRKIDASTFGITIVDMQRNFFGSILKNKKESIIDNHVALLKEIENTSIPIFTLEYRGKEKTIIHIREANPHYETLTFEKNDSNGFLGSEGYRKTVGLKNITNMLYTGLYSNFCVIDTGLGGNYLGINPIFSKDLMVPDTMFGTKEQIKKIEKMMKKYGTVFNNYKSLLDVLT